MLGRCPRLRAFARARGFELDGDPIDLRLLDGMMADSAVTVTELGQLRTASLANEAGLYLGSVIVGTVSGSRWNLWPNGHPVVRLPSGQDLDVVALVSDQVAKGAPGLAGIYARAAAGGPG